MDAKRRPAAWRHRVKRLASDETVSVVSTAFDGDTRREQGKAVYFLFDCGVGSAMQFCACFPES
jgi:hypothetical protein